MLGSSSSFDVVDFLGLRQEPSKVLGPTVLIEEILGALQFIHRYLNPLGTLVEGSWTVGSSFIANVTLAIALCRGLEQTP